MALAGYPFPYDIDNLLGGAVRILRAPTSQAIPAGIQDVIDLSSPYAAKTGWVELGATKEAFTYTRGFATSGWEIQQLAGNVIEEITNITRTLQVSAAEFNAATLAIIEGRDPATAPGTIAAAAHRSAQKVLKFGSFVSLERFRIAFIARRATESGLVTEEDGTSKRGRFVMGCAYSAQIGADDAAIEQNKGALSAASVRFTCFPDASIVLAEESWGSWFFEDAGTISAT